jgi:hypothetical protein
MISTDSPPPYPEGAFFVARPGIILNAMPVVLRPSPALARRLATLEAEVMESLCKPSQYGDSAILFVNVETNRRNGGNSLGSYVASDRNQD